MSTPAHRRLMQDLKRMQKDPPMGISGAPTEEDLLKWEAIIIGPEGTPYENGIFKLEITFPELYPMNPPKIRFTSKMFHPNIYENGFVCMNTLASLWSPAFDVATILTSVQSLLAEPNPASAANCKATFLYLEDKKGYNKVVKECVKHTLE